MAADVSPGRYQAAELHLALNADRIAFKRDARVGQAIDFLDQVVLQVFPANGRRHIPAFDAGHAQFLIHQGLQRLEVDPIEVTVKIGELQIAGHKIRSMNGNRVDIAEKNLSSRRCLDADIIVLQIKFSRQGL